MTPGYDPAFVTLIVVPVRSICRARFSSDGHWNVVNSTLFGGIVGVWRSDSSRVFAWQHRSIDKSCKFASRRPDPPPPGTPPAASLRAAGSSTPASCDAATAFISPNVGLSTPSSLTHV